MKSTRVSLRHQSTSTKWQDDCRSRFHCQIGNDDEKICNIELWKRDFYELSRDCIILIHSILGRFIAGTMKIGKKIPKNIYQLFPLIKNSYINYINKVIITVYQ